MENKFDISDFISTPTQQSVLAALTERVKERRKELKLTQKTLALRSGVSYASVRRFEQTGDISLASLLKIAGALDCLEDFNALFRKKKITNLKEFQE